MEKQLFDRLSKLITAMNKSGNNIILVIFSIGMFMLGIYVINLETITIPGRITTHQNELSSSGIFYLGGAMSTFANTIRSHIPYNDNYPDTAGIKGVEADINGFLTGKGKHPLFSQLRFAITPEYAIHASIKLALIL